MHADRPSPGWPWLDAEVAPRPAVIEDACLACFASMPGQLVMAHLRRVFLDRRVPPGASDAELRHVEGQRSVVAWLLAMASPDRTNR